MSSNNLIVQALAGTGKTFTIVEGIKSMRGKLDRSITPSEQQQAIWDHLGIMDSDSAICLAAFNVTIKKEMERRLANMNNCHVTTFHSMGLRAISNFFGRSGIPVRVDKKKTDHLLSTLHNGESAWDLNKTIPGYPAAVRRLVQLCKYNVLEVRKGEEPSDDKITVLAAQYGVNLGSNTELIFDSVRKILLTAASQSDWIDFDDMVWLPVILDLPITCYDLLLVDEGQDLNFCQQRLALKAGERIVLVGDKNQAIYGFAGADTQSMSTMYNQLVPVTRNGCRTLPLTITRRCSFAVVKEAQKIVPEFKAYPTNSKGNVAWDNTSWTAPGDMVICRTNAPLVSQAFQFINNGLPAEIIGRDIKGNLIELVKMLKADSVQSLITKLHKYEENEVSRLNKRRSCPKSLILAIEDKCACLRIFTRKSDNIHSVICNINKVFSEHKGPSIRLSSIHRAKGLEARNVFILEPEKLPHPMATLDWEMEQEKNLKYVAITRAIDNLIWVERKDDQCSL